MPSVCDSTTQWMLSAQYQCQHCPSASQLTQWIANVIFYCYPSLPTSCCRWENGSMCILPMETSFGHWNMLLLSQDENPIIGRIFAGNPNIRFFRIGT